MASGAISSADTSSWTPERNKLFENALARYDQGEPDRWLKVAEAVGTNEEEVKRMYEILLHDITLIESGKIPIPKYKKNSNSGRSSGCDNITNQELR
ncbi:hypothetical protein SLE2022_303410 [Rubroshorea leprosula]